MRYDFRSKQKETIVTPRIPPLSAPYPADVQAAFDRIMPNGIDPLVLFRTLSSVPRIWEKFRAGSLLDKGPLSLRQREIVIDRTTALLGCEYEWGVHIAFFAERAGFSAEQVASTVTGADDAACWSPDERALFDFAPENIDWWDYWINIHIPALRRWCYPLMEGRPLEAREARVLDWSVPPEGASAATR